MKNVIAVALLCAALSSGLAVPAAAAAWEEYSRGSEAWHRTNRDAMLHPWKYDRGGRLRGGPWSRRSRAGHARARVARAHPVWKHSRRH